MMIIPPLFFLSLSFLFKTLFKYFLTMVTRNMCAAASIFLLLLLPPSFCHPLYSLRFRLRGHLSICSSSYIFFFFFFYFLFIFIFPSHLLLRRIRHGKRARRQELLSAAYLAGALLLCRFFFSGPARPGS